MEKERFHNENVVQASLFRDIGLLTGAKLKNISIALQSLCSDTDPLFIQIGRDLQKVSTDTKNLTGSMLETAHLVSDENTETGIFDRTGSLAQSIMDSLATGRQSLEISTKNVRELVGRIHEFHNINDEIDTISSRFKVVRFNIRIQCNSMLISEHMFKGVTDDIDSLSRKLQSITTQIKNDLSASARKLMTLEHSVTKNLLQLKTFTDEAQEAVSQAFQDIRQLMQGASVMIEEAGTRSDRISQKIDDVVVSIQFHDSMSQRVAHIQRAFDDICVMSDPEDEDITEECLGSSWLILDLQHRQLGQIIDEVSTVKQHIYSAFQIIEEEVSGLNAIQCNAQFEAIGPQQFLSSLFTSLKDTLLKLCTLTSDSTLMLEPMRTSARETESIAAKLQEMMTDVQEVREDTRLQAVNTIIMASNLGQKGRTIHVLAQEINSLSGKTGVVAGDAVALQVNINKKVTELLENSEKNADSIDPAEVDNISQKIGAVFSEVEQRIARVSSGIQEAGSHVDKVRSSLSFLEDLQDRLKDITAQVEDVKELLDPWKDQASLNSGQMEQLIERYTMEQERAVHSFDQEDGQQEEQGDEDIFF